MLFLRICFSVPVLEGYGMTEAACTMTITHQDSTALGNVGYPNSAVEVKLEDIPDMGYTNADKPNPRGEVSLPGPSLDCQCPAGSLQAGTDCKASARYVDFFQ